VELRPAGKWAVSWMISPGRVGKYEAAFSPLHS
jgi:hypothetical protein